MEQVEVVLESSGFVDADPAARERARVAYMRRLEGAGAARAGAPARPAVPPQSGKGGGEATP